MSSERDPHLPPLPAAVKRLGWVSFFTDVSSEMIFPLLPTFLTTVLGASPFALGLIEGVSDSVSSLLKLVSGYFSDRIKKRRLFVLIGYGLSSCLRPLIGISHHWLTVFGIRFGDRIGKGIRSAPRDALIAAVVDQHNRGRAFGFHRMMDHAGAVVGSLIGAGFIFFAPGHYRQIFLLASIPAFCAISILYKLKEVESPASLRPEQGVKKEVSPPYGLPRGVPQRVKVFLTLLFLFTLGNATDAFLLLRLQSGGIAIAYLPLLWAGFHVIKAYGNQWFGTFSDGREKGVFIFFGWLTYSLAYLLFALSLSKIQLALLFLGYGIFYGLTESPEKALLAEWAPSESYGAIYGFYHTILGVALLPAGLLFGFLWKTGGYPYAFRLISIIGFLSALLWGAYYWRTLKDLKRGSLCNEKK